MTLTFFHTSPVHIKTFDALLASQALKPEVQHLVREDLLAAAKDARGVTPAVAAGVEAVIRQVASSSGVILCTCSTLGAVAEGLAKKYSAPVLRVDRPMAERAVHLGEKIVVVAALASTLEPTRLLLEEAASGLTKDVEISLSLAETAWTYFEAGDISSYHKAVARHLERVEPEGDVLVLAQASMMGAAQLARLDKPALSSPEIGLAAALELYRQTIV